MGLRVIRSLPRCRPEAGTALPTSVAALSIVGVLAAGAVFVLTDPATDPPSAVPVGAKPAAPSETSPATSVTTAQDTPRPKRKPEVKRGEVYVEVYNNSGISGLAGATAARASGAGWNVVGSDNWYGTVDASTVYYPPRLERAAKMLARDLGIKRTRPAMEPMRLDRLTVILTADYA